MRRAVTKDAGLIGGESLELAARSDARKHVARAQGLQGRVLHAQGRLDEAARVLRASIRLAETVKTPREAWMGRAALGRVSYQMGSDKDAEALFTEAARTIETIAGGLTTPSLRSGFLSAPPVAEVYRMIGRRPPDV